MEKSQVYKAIRLQTWTGLEGSGTGMTDIKAFMSDERVLTVNLVVASISVNKLTFLVALDLCSEGNAWNNGEPSFGISFTRVLLHTGRL
jgi:hypothetical protein